MEAQGQKVREKRIRNGESDTVIYIEFNSTQTTTHMYIPHNTMSGIHLSLSFSSSIVASNTHRLACPCIPLPYDGAQGGAAGD